MCVCVSITQFSVIGRQLILHHKLVCENFNIK